jgi:hypothetical protein
LEAPSVGPACVSAATLAPKRGLGVVVSAVTPRCTERRSLQDV